MTLVTLHTSTFRIGTANRTHDGEFLRWDSTDTFSRRKAFSISKPDFRRPNSASNVNPIIARCLLEGLPRMGWPSFVRSIPLLRFFFLKSRRGTIAVCPVLLLVLLFFSSLLILRG